MNFTESKIKYFEKISKANIITSKILKGNWWISMILIIFTITSIVSATLHFLDIYTIPGIVDQEKWIQDLYIFITFFAGIFSSIGILMQQRQHKGFLIWSGPAIILYFVNALILNTWYRALLLAFMFALKIVQHFIWNKKDENGEHEEKEIITSKWYVNLGIYSFAIISIGLLGWGMDSITETNPVPYTDAATLIIALCTQYYMIKKNIFLHAFMLPGAVINITLLIRLGDWMTLSRALFSIVTVVFGFIMWQTNYYNQEYKNKEKNKKKVSAVKN